MIGELWRKSRWIMLFSIATGLLAGLGGVGLIVIINTVLGMDHREAGSLGWLFAASCALLILARALSTLLLVRLGQNTVYALRLALTRRILAAPYATLQRLGPARIVACLTQDVATLAEAFGWLHAFCVNGAIVAGCIVYLGWLSDTMLGLVGLALALGVSSFAFIEAKARTRLSRARDCDDALHGHFRSLTHGIKELKLHRARRDDFVARCLEDTASSYRRHYLAGAGLSILAGNWANSLFYVVIGVVLFLLPGYSPVEPEVLRGYCVTVLYLMSHLAGVIDSLPIFSRARIALNKIESLGAESGNGEGAGPAAAPSTLSQPQRLEMRAVSHRYYTGRDDLSFTLGPIDLVLEPGEVVFLVGGNGSGKTTLSLLLAGLYWPEQGEILLGGRKIGAATAEYYRQQFSAVFSDYYLFESLLGFESRELDDQARAYLANLQLDHKVKVQDGGFSTTELSQGQRKRLALLVAYLEDRPFYIFDEWAADQDPVFKKVFYTQILASLKARGKSVVVITHDDGYFDVADRCLKLEHGRLIDISARRGVAEGGRDTVHRPLGGGAEHPASADRLAI